MHLILFSAEADSSGVLNSGLNGRDGVLKISDDQ